MTTRAQRRKAAKDLKANLCLRAFVTIGELLEKYPPKLQQRILRAVNLIYGPRP